MRRRRSRTRGGGLIADWMEGPEGVPAGEGLLLMLPSSSREVIARWIYAQCYKNAHVYIEVDMYAPPHLDVIPCRTPPHPCVADNISVYPAPHSPTHPFRLPFPPHRAPCWALSSRPPPCRCTSPRKRSTRAWTRSPSSPPSSACSPTSSPSSSSNSTAKVPPIPPSGTCTVKSSSSL